MPSAKFWNIDVIRKVDVIIERKKICLETMTKWFIYNDLSNLNSKFRRVGKKRINEKKN